MSKWFIHNKDGLILLPIILTDLHKPNNKLVSALLEHFWCMDELRNGIRKSDKRVNYSHRLARTKQQVSYCIVGAFLVHGWATGKHRLIRLTTARIWGSHHLSPHNILYAWPQGQHPNVILSQNSQVGVPKFFQLGLSQLWGPITLCANLRLKWGLKQHWDLSNSMCHASCTQGN